MNKMKTFGACTSALTLSLLSAAVVSGERNETSHLSSFNADNVRIYGLSMAGSGCPAGSVSAHVGTDGHSLVFDFEEFYAEVGPGVPLSKSRRFCNLTFSLDVPAGKQYAIQQVDYEGYAYLEEGAGMQHKSSFFFAGRPEEAQLKRTLYGYFNGNFSGADHLSENQLLWSECGGDDLAALTTSVRVFRNHGSDARGYVSKDNQSISQYYLLKVRDC